MSSALSSCDMSWNTIACPPESTRSYHLASVSTGASPECHVPEFS